MSYNLSVCVFIKDTFTGAFCLWESMAALLPFSDEFLIMDLGSTDGTRETLNDIAMTNPKVRLLAGEFPSINAMAFAKLANDLVRECKHDRVLYYQADEIWHQDLLRLMKQKFDEGNFDLSFWRIQYANNFQYVKWFPHLVHRVGDRQGKQFYFAEKPDEYLAANHDGMNTVRVWEATLCSNYDGGYFPRWGAMGQDGIKPYTNEMIMDVSLLGGFRDNIIERRAKHAPFWGEEPTVPYFDPKTYRQWHIPASDWIDRAMNNPDWTRPETPYNIPQIMRWHVGRTKYELRPELLEALKNNTTEAMVGL